MQPYGELSPIESGELANHVAECAACRADRASLQRVRAALTDLAVPEVRVDVGAIVRTTSDQQARSLRRWKRIAAVTASLAAGLMLLLLVRPEIRVGDGALIVRWQPAREPPSSAPIQPDDSEQLQKLDLLAQLVRAMADDAESRDRDRSQQIESIRQRLELVQSQGDGRWQDIQRDMGVLYRAQFARKEGTE